MDHVERFKAAKKNIEDTKESRRIDRWGKKLERRKWQRSTSVSKGYDPDYAEGWDRIFGSGEPETPPTPPGEDKCST